ncbi:hypothetical protein ACFLU3_05940, partial [Chloroflexota bacterium]
RNSLPESKLSEGFMDIVKALSDALRKDSKLNASTKSLRSDWHKAVQIRNKYAHADLGFTNEVPEIKYKKRKDGQEETVIEPITEDNLNNDLEFLTNVKDDMRSVYFEIKRR